MVKNINFLTIGVLSLAIASLCFTSCDKGWDPSEGDFFENVGYYSNGSYFMPIAGTDNEIALTNADAYGDVKADLKNSTTSYSVPQQLTFGGKTYTVTSIGEGVFDNFRNLASVTFPNTITSIGNGAFLNCISLTNINLPNSLISIGERAFSFCEKLASITLPASLTSIGNGAFLHCISLTNINLPNSLTSIGDGAFGECHALMDITCLATTPPAGAHIFDPQTYEEATLHVPAAAVDAYKAAQGWSMFQHIVGF